MESGLIPDTSTLGNNTIWLGGAVPEGWQGGGTRFRVGSQDMAKVPWGVGLVHRNHIERDTNKT